MHSTAFSFFLSSFLSKHGESSEGESLCRLIGNDDLLPASSSDRFQKSRTLLRVRKKATQ